MSHHDDSTIVAQIRRMDTALTRALAKTATGTANARRWTTRIDLALANAEARMADQAPALHVWERGDGTTGLPNPDAEENELRARVARQARVDFERLTKIGRELDHLQREMTNIIDRQVEVAPPPKRPKADDMVPGCTSCARTETDNGTKIGNHFAPVYDKSIKSGLCRFCWRCRSATGQLPPVKACDILHTQGARAAGLWLARNMPETDEAMRQADDPKTSITVEDLTLRPDALIVAEGTGAS